MKYPKINVIVPIYNAENYITGCVESILTQSYQNIEVILVDDGSTDSSGKICDDYASNYDNVQVVHTTNQGSSYARNMGISLVKEGFISFIDADDSFSNVDMFAKISKIIELYNPDFIDFGINYISNNGEITTILNGVKKECLLDKNYIFDKILPPLLNLTGDKENFIFDFAWNKIYKKEIIDKYNVKFIPNRRIWEDRPFVIEYVSHCESYYSLNEYFYNYKYVSNSLSQKYTNEFFDVILENYNSYREKFKDKFNFETQYVYSYWCNSLLNMLKRSLSQNMVPYDAVQKKINEIFSQEIVISLFKKRVQNDDTEKTISDYVVDGNIDKLIRYYETIIKKENHKSNFRKFLSKAKHILKR